MKILRRMILNLAESIIPMKSDSDVYLLMERLENSKVSEETPSSQHYSGGMTNTITTSNWNETVSNEQEYNEDDIFNEKDDEDQNERRSKSFTFFNEEDFNDVNYLFINEESKKKKNKRKRKKTNVEQNKVTSEVEEKDEDAGMKKQLIRTINSLSQTDLRVFYDNVSKDNKICLS